MTVLAVSCPGGRVSELRSSSFMVITCPFARPSCERRRLGLICGLRASQPPFPGPSQGKLLPYPSDEAHIELSENHFLEFIQHLAQSPGLEEINVLAHSMGNRLLCRAIPKLIELQRRGQIRVPIGHVVLAAADLSTEFFKQHASLYKQLARRRITNYSCAADKALFASKSVHGLGRVGLEPPIFVHDGIDTVSASGLNVDLLGRGYFASVEPLLYDIGELIHHDTEPPRRLRIVPGPAELGLHWVLTR